MVRDSVQEKHLKRKNDCDAGLKFVPRISRLSGQMPANTFRVLIRVIQRKPGGRCIISSFFSVESHLFFIDWVCTPLNTLKALTNNRKNILLRLSWLPHKVLNKVWCAIILSNIYITNGLYLNHFNSLFVHVLQGLEHRWHHLAVKLTLK